jgi:hypothetical protein
LVTYPWDRLAIQAHGWQGNTTDKRADQRLELDSFGGQRLFGDVSCVGGFAGSHGPGADFAGRGDDEVDSAIPEQDGGAVLDGDSRL